MSHATYLVRFDDICPTMNWEAWEQVENVLVTEGIKPMLAVVPDNRDENLEFGQENEHFWSKVLYWQKMGWSIAVHGYQHLYQTNDPGLVGLNKYSEFSGLSYELQSKKLQKALSIFESHDIKPNLWIAPAHSFDKVTVRVLSDLGIEIISDGFFKGPVKYMNMIYMEMKYMNMMYISVRNIYELYMHITVSMCVNCVCVYAQIVTVPMCVSK